LESVVLSPKSPVVLYPHVKIELSFLIAAVFVLEQKTLDQFELVPVTCIGELC
jgi:hypothetical protein